MSKRSDKAARRFFEALIPGAEWSFTNHKAIPLIRAAFSLYEAEWRDGWSISRWEWPFTILAKGDQFEGDEPWTVLLRRAVDISQERR